MPEIKRFDRVVSWILTILAMASAVAAIWLRFEIAEETLRHIAFRSWCPVGTWHMTSVQWWGPMLLIPCFVGWYSAIEANIWVWPARLAAVAATSWWVIGSTASSWPQWLM